MTLIHQTYLPGKMRGEDPQKIIQTLLPNDKKNTEKLIASAFSLAVADLVGERYFVCIQDEEIDPTPDCYLLRHTPRKKGTRAKCSGFPLELVRCPQKIDDKYCLDDFVRAIHEKKGKKAYEQGTLLLIHDFQNDNDIELKELYSSFTAYEWSFQSIWIHQLQENTHNFIQIYPQISITYEFTKS